MNKNLMRFLALISLGFAYGSIYLLPYMKSVFYNPMLAATGFNNAQLGMMITMYTLGTTLTYLPGGWVADKVSPRKIIPICLVGNALLSFVFYFVCTNFYLSMLIWLLSAFCGGFAFWPAMLKSIRLLGKREEQGRIYGLFEGVNGLASLCGSALMVWVSTWFGNEIAGFQGAVIAMGVLCLLAALFFYLTFDEHMTFNEDAAEEEGKIKLQDFLKVLTLPTVWVPALLLFGGVTMFGTMSYMNPFLIDKMGVAAVSVAFMSSLRDYGCRIGGFGGGWMADKVFKSSAKWQVMAHALNAILIVAFIFIPAGNKVLSITLMFLFALVTYANRVTTYSMLSELRVPAKVTATALALMTLIGYSPDFFIHIMYGNWIDQYGVAGFDKIFTYAACIAVACIPLALFGVAMSRKINKSA
ncbi:MFS transporter [Deltaproteobacteria bacterium OttesenSCG-928-K17]|nr:MFS transporter [Deltaproteobacteria bacterium OttesenSCG-928-K17]